MHAIVLAAGTSTRMGDKNKLLLPYGNETVLSHVIGQVTASDVERVIVITGWQREAVLSSLATHLHSQVEEKFNQDFKLGQVTSIQTGVGHIPEDVEGIMICLGDMPLLNSTDYNHVIHQYQTCVEDGKTPILRPIINGKKGHPVIWHPSHVDTIKNFSGSHSMKDCINQLSDHFTPVEITKDAHYLDMDTPMAYEKILRLRKSL